MQQLVKSVEEIDLEVLRAFVLMVNLMETESIVRLVITLAQNAKLTEQIVSNVKEIE